MRRTKKHSKRKLLSLAKHEDRETRILHRMGLHREARREVANARSFRKRAYGR